MLKFWHEKTSTLNCGMWMAVLALGFLTMYTIRLYVAVIVRSPLLSSPLPRPGSGDFSFFFFPFLVIRLPSLITKQYNRVTVGVRGCLYNIGPETTIKNLLSQFALLSIANPWQKKKIDYTRP